MTGNTGLKLLSIPILATSLLNVAHAQTPVSLGNGCFVIKQKCKATIKQTKWGFELNNVKFGSGDASGSVKLGSDLIQKLTDIAQILDQMQLARCQTLNSLTTCDDVRQKLLAVHVLASEQLGQLAILAQMFSGKPDQLKEAILAWIARSSDLIDKIYAKLFLAAGGDADKNLKTAHDAADYVAAELKISRDSTAYRGLLRDPLKNSLE